MVHRNRCSVLLFVNTRQLCTYKPMKKSGKNAWDFWRCVCVLCDRIWFFFQMDSFFFQAIAHQFEYTCLYIFSIIILTYWLKIDEKTKPEKNVNQAQSSSVVAAIISVWIKILTRLISFVRAVNCFGFLWLHEFSTPFFALQLVFDAYFDTHFIMHLMQSL